VFDKNCVVGFQLNSSTWRYWWKTRERFERRDWWEEDQSDDNIYWNQRVFDHMIFFKPEWFNTSVVKHWWNKESLLAAEWGWWQTLCYAKSLEKHINVNGVVPIVRHLEGYAHSS